MIYIKEISSEDTYEIRKEVLRKGIPKPYTFEGDLDEATFHLGAFKDDVLIGVSSFMKAAHGELTGVQYQLRGMATLSNYQGLGAGRQLIEHAKNILREMNIDVLWCNARIIAVPFYEKQGFNVIGNAFEIEYIGTHFTMYTHLN